jgi:hypothetical protein
VPVASRILAWAEWWRRWLDDNLFPEAPPIPMSVRRVALVAGVSIVSVVVLLARMWPSKPLNSIYAEDGYIWLADALHHGFLHDLATPYNGYIQALPRLVAAPVALLPIDWYAAAMAITGALIVTGCAVMVWWSSAGHIRNPLLRLFLASMVVLLPVVGVESLDNVTNSIWFLLFTCFWVLLWRPASVAGAVVGALVLLLATLSDAGAALFLPIWGLRVLAARDLRDGLMVGGYGLGIGIELGASWGSQNILGEAGGQAAWNQPHWDWALVPAYLQRVVGGSITGQRISGLLWDHLGVAFEVVLGALLLLLVVAAVFWGSRRTRVIVPVTVATSLLVFLFSGYQRWASAGVTFLWPAGSSSSHAAHYMIVPTLLLLSAIVVQLDTTPPALTARAWRIATIAGTCFIGVAALLTFNVSSSARGQSTWLAAVQTGRVNCREHRFDTTTVLIAPNGYVPVYMQVPCHTLIGSAAPLFPKRSSVLAAPSRTTTWSGTTVLRARVSDEVHVVSVDFYVEAYGPGSYPYNVVVVPARKSAVGWSSVFDTGRVANGTYDVQSVATYQGGELKFSPPVSVVVRN